MNATAALALRQPPMNLEAEQALLAACMANNRAIERVDGLVEPQHFADPLHGRIFAELLRRGRLNLIADPVTLFNAFRDDPGLQEAGGPEYFAQLVAATVGIINAADYANAVRDAWARREVIETCAETIEAAFGTDAAAFPEAAQVLAHVEAGLTRISQGLTTDTAAISAGAAVGLAAQGVQEAAQREGRVLGVTMGYEALDRTVGGLRNGCLWYLGARPAMGKTALGLAIAARAAARGARVLFHSLEMPAQQLGLRLLAAATGISTESLGRGKADDPQYGWRDFTAREWDLVNQAQAEAAALPLVIDDRSALSVAEIRARARKELRTGGLDLVVVDYMGLIRPTEAGSRKASRYAEVTEISADLLALARSIDRPVLCLAQLSRALEGRENRMPTMADLRDSGALEQDAFGLMFLHREEYYLRREQPAQKPGEASEKFDQRLEQHMKRLAAARGGAQVNIAKNRQGPEGLTRLRFDARRTWFWDESDFSRDADGHLDELVAHAWKPAQAPLAALPAR